MQDFSFVLCILGVHKLFEHPFIVTFLVHIFFQLLDEVVGQLVSIHIDLVQRFFQESTKLLFHLIRVDDSTPRDGSLAS